MGLLDRLLRRPRTPAVARPDADAVLARLEALGWFRYTPPDALPAVRAQVRESIRLHNIADAEWDNACTSGDRRSVSGDAETLAEGGVGEALTALAPMLAQEGVTLPELQDDTDGEAYALHVGGERFEVFPAGTQDAWLEAFVRTLEIANTLLARAGSAARLYGQLGGNDGRLVLLTPELAQALEELGLDEGWRPYPAEVARRHNA